MRTYFQKIASNKFAAICALFLSPILGFFAFFIPVLFKYGIDTGKRKECFSALIGYTFENTVPLPTLILLFCLGFMLGLAGSRIWFILGLLTIFIFPINAVYEMNIDPSSHNLWPFEFFIYILFTVPALIGAFFGSKKSRKYPSINI